MCADSRLVHVEHQREEILRVTADDGERRLRLGRQPRLALAELERRTLVRLLPPDETTERLEQRGAQLGMRVERGADDFRERRERGRYVGCAGAVPGEQRPHLRGEYATDGAEMAPRWLDAER